MKVTSSETLAALAAVIDCDGSISVLGKGGRGMQMQICVQVGMTRPEWVNLFAEIAGCKVHKYVFSTRYKPKFQVAITDRKAADLLGAILPHLRIKRRIAEVALYCYERMRSASGKRDSVDDKEFMTRVKLVAVAKKLNRGD